MVLSPELEERDGGKGRNERGREHWRKEIGRNKVEENFKDIKS